MSQSTQINKQVIILTGLMSATLLAVGVLLGAWLTEGRQSQLAAPLKLNAAAASAGKNISLATGLIDEDIEALFILDHLNGNLQCWILNVRTSTVGGIYRTNVLPALGEGKAGAEFDFAMTTGYTNFTGNRGQSRPAQCVCYVAEGNSGTAAGFGFTFNRNNIQRGQAQEGELEVVCQGPIRDLQIRDQ